LQVYWKGFDEPTWEPEINLVSEIEENNFSKIFFHFQRSCQQAMMAFRRRETIKLAKDRDQMEELERKDRKKTGKGNKANNSDDEEGEEGDSNANRPSVHFEEEQEVKKGSLGRKVAKKMPGLMRSSPRPTTAAATAKTTTVANAKIVKVGHQTVRLYFFLNPIFLRNRTQQRKMPHQPNPLLAPWST
jgi:hypothetical protein